MKWKPKYKVGQKVRVVNKISFWKYEWECGWVDVMDNSIGNVYQIESIGGEGYLLKTEGFNGMIYNYCYCERSLKLVSVPNQQLAFPFMMET